MPIAIKPGQKILFTGDSITDCGRRGHAAPLGEGYVRFVSDLLAARHPELQATIINTGISGHTVRDLRDRWTDDVIRHQPDWLSIKIGINDIHRWIHKVQGASVTAEEFAVLYDEVLARVKKETKAQIVLVDPFYLSIDTSPNSARSTVLKELPSYIKTVHAMVKKYKTRHVKTHDIFQNLLKHYPSDRFCPEPVHPNHAGHLVIADNWVKAVGG